MARVWAWVRRHKALVVVGLLLATAVIYPAAAARVDAPTTVNLSRAYSLIDSGEVDKASIADESNTLSLTTADGERYSTAYPFGSAPSLVDSLREADVPVSVDARGGSSLGAVLLSILPITLVIIVIIIAVRTGFLQNGFTAFKGKRGQSLGAVPKTTFADVAGVDEARDQLAELVDVLRDPRRYARLGAKPPAGALLSGPPGTGKTLLARAVAGEAKVPFFALSGSDFIETFAGAGAARVRAVFDKARAKGRAIIFIDEVDSVGRKRGSSGEGSMSNEEDRTLTALLSEMDGFTSSEIIVIAATNVADILDPALTRPGRLDRRIEVPLPDPRGREHILGVHARSRRMDEGVDLAVLARRTTGMSGAELEQVINEGALVAVRAGAKTVRQVDLLAAVDNVTLGRARTSAVVTAADRRITAWHEGGHVAVSALLTHAPAPVYVTVVPRGDAGGFTKSDSGEDRFTSREQALARLAVLMGGRAAETIALGEDGITQGASGDIDQATRIATEMITRYGMMPGRLSAISPDPLRLGSQVGAEVGALVEQMLAAALQTARDVLESTSGSALLSAVATALIEREELHEDELLALADSVGAGRGMVLVAAATKEAVDLDKAPAPVRDRRGDPTS